MDQTASNGAAVGEITGQSARGNSNDLAVTNGTAQAPLPRVMFVTVGRTPRADIVPAIVEMLDLPIDPHEIGVLDQLSQEDIAKLTATADEAGLSTYLSENIRVVLSRDGVAARFNAILRKFRPNEYDLVVILSTGLSVDFVSGCPSVNAQRAVESALLSFVPKGKTIGVIFPLPSQAKENAHLGTTVTMMGYPVMYAWAREGDDEGIGRALMSLAAADVILLNSISYTEADFDLVAQVTQKPVLLPRRALAGAIRIVLQRAQARIAPALSAETRRRMARLTPREREVLDLVCDGLSNKAIANVLSISPKTVEVHRSHVMAKMEVPTLGVLLNLVLGRRSDHMPNA